MMIKSTTQIQNFSLSSNSVAAKIEEHPKTFWATASTISATALAVIAGVFFASHPAGWAIAAVCVLAITTIGSTGMLLRAWNRKPQLFPTPVPTRFEQAISWIKENPKKIALGLGATCALAAAAYYYRPTSNPNPRQPMTWEWLKKQIAWPAAAIGGIFLLEGIAFGGYHLGYFKFLHRVAPRYMKEVVQNVSDKYFLPQHNLLDRIKICFSHPVKREYDHLYSSAKKGRLEIALAQGNYPHALSVQFPVEIWLDNAQADSINFDTAELLVKSQQNYKKSHIEIHKKDGAKRENQLQESTHSISLRQTREIEPHGFTSFIGKGPFTLTQADYDLTQPPAHS